MIKNHEYKNNLKSLFLFIIYSQKCSFSVYYLDQHRKARMCILFIINKRFYIKNITEVLFVIIAYKSVQRWQ